MEAENPAEADVIVAPPPVLDVMWIGFNQAAGRYARPHQRRDSKPSTTSVIKKRTFGACTYDVSAAIKDERMNRRKKNTHDISAKTTHSLGIYI
jgi:hypothetical protein